MSILQSEVAVIGAGMIGAAIALGLAQNGFQIIVIDHQKPPTSNIKQQPSIRVSAINSSSVTLLKSLGVWDAIQPTRIHPYRQLEIWEWENAHVSLNSCDLNLPELGFTVENYVLQNTLWSALYAHPSVTLFYSAKLKNFYRQHNYWIIYLSDRRTIKASMIIGADGANSQVRKIAGINIYSWQYNQSCMLITVKCKFNPGNSIWQHFTPTGPHAFLPLYDHWASLAWYGSTFYIRQLQNMSMFQLQQAIVNTFPSRLGTVTPIASGEFLFTSHHALQYVLDGLALIGDAAHTIHPLLGQGVNLGYRDVNTLLKVMINARNYGKNWTDIRTLKYYQLYRQADNFLMQGITDLFYVGFCNNLTPLRIIRNLGLMLTQRTSILKRLALNYAIGL